MSDDIGYTGAPKIGPKIDPGGGVSINAPAEAFGVGTFAAIHKLGETGFEAALSHQKLANDIEHNRLALDTSQKFNEEWERMASKEGMAAHNYLPQFQSNLKKLYNDSINGAPNDAIREKLASTMFRDVDRWMNHGSNYAGSQLRNAHHEVHSQALEDNVNKVEMMREQPIPDIIEQVKHGTGGLGGLDSVRERLHSRGIDFHDENGKEIPENMATYRAEEAKFWGKALGPTIDALAENWENGPKGRADLRKAEELFKQTRDNMDAKTANLLDKKLQPKLDKAAVEDMANERHPIPDEPGHFPTTAAGQRRAMMESIPSRENAAKMGIGAPAAKAAHPSDFFVKLERGNAGLDYINTKDSKGSHSYGSLGLNSLGGETSSAARFAKANPHLGLDGEPGSMAFDRSWQKAAHEKPDELRAAERKWWDDKYLNPVSGKLKAAGVPASIADNRLVQLYMADRNVQQGEAIIDRHASRMKEAAQQANGDPKKFLDIVRSQDVSHLQGDFGTSLGTGAYSATGHQTRLNGRMETAQKALDAETGGPAATATTQPASPQDSLLAPGGMSRAQHREDNLIAAQKAFPGNPVRQHLYYNELNRRDVLIRGNLSGERQFVDATMKEFDLRVSKGLPGLTLESTGLTEDRIRAAHRDKPWVAEHIIESFRLQSANADKLSSLKFAPKEDWDTYLRDASNGLGIDTAIKTHRDKSGTHSAFDLGANPEAKGEIMSNDFAIKEKVAATARRAYSEHMQEIQKDPAGYLINAQNPAIMKAKQAVDAAGNDPVKRADAFREYTSKLHALQVQMGVPEEKTRILTNGMAEKTVSDIMKSDNPKKDLENLKSAYGNQFNPIFKDLVVHGKLPSKLEALIDLDNQNSNILAGRIKAEAGEKGNEHRRQMDTLLGDKRAKIAKAVRDDDTTKQWMLSLAHSGVSDPQRAEVHNTVNMLAEARVLDLGEDVSTASSEAVKAFTRNLKFTNDHVAIPADKYEAVMAEANDHLKFLDPNNIVVPHAVKEQGHSSEWYTGTIQSTRSWKATPDRDGMYLVDHGGNPVIVNNNGKPEVVKVDFNNPKRSISNASPLSRAPNLFFEGIGD